MQADGRNRLVLRDIGNFVTTQPVECKPQNQITRPVTRSFGAQLLATAQAATEKNICKKPLVENMKDVASKVAKKDGAGGYVQLLQAHNSDGRVHDYMESQPDINSLMIGILVDWLIEVHIKFELTTKSLYLTGNIMDRSLSLKGMERRELQLIGIISMLIVCKYEDIWAPEVSDLIAISNNAYAREQMLVLVLKI